MAADISNTHVLDALRNVVDPVSGKDIVTLGMVSGVTVQGRKIGFIVTIDVKNKERGAALEALAKQSVMKAIPQAESVTVILTAQSGAEDPRAKAVWNKTPIPNVARVIAVASGKGGVGKSTTAVNLARAFKRGGKKVGLLDADIYGPSLPRMMGLTGQPEIKDNLMLPLMSADGIACMSMGFIAGEDTAVVWRGPKITKALHQLARQTLWPELDILLVDMPPGTGDVHISMVQQVPLSGAVIVTTPQEIALLDARKCADMFTQVGVPLLGVIENMSYFEDPAGNRHALFGEGGGAKLAAEKNTILLGHIPLIPELREASDSGTASLSAQSNDAFDIIAKKVI